ncbi:hypothetical protein PENTCL1PPCAC_30171, partial [Pristionchus entomophagus]
EALFRRGWEKDDDPPADPSFVVVDDAPTTSSSTSASSANSPDMCDSNWTGPNEQKYGVLQDTFDRVRRARKQDVNLMFHLGIVNAVEWASQFAVFCDLKTQSKRELLKEYSIAFMLVDQGFNTSKQDDDTLWILQHDKVYMCTDYMHGLPEQDRTHYMAKTKAKIHPDFVLECIQGVGTPMRELQIEEFECVLLKTLLLFECFNVYPADSKSEIASIRQRCLKELTAYEAVKHPHHGIERIGILLLMIGNIRNCIHVTCRLFYAHDIFSLMRFEPLVADVYLNKE